MRAEHAFHVAEKFCFTGMVWIPDRIIAGKNGCEITKRGHYRQNGFRLTAEVEDWIRDHGASYWSWNSKTRRLGFRDPNIAFHAKIRWG